MYMYIYITLLFVSKMIFRLVILVLSSISITKMDHFTDVDWTYYFYKFVYPNS